MVNIETLSRVLPEETQPGSESGDATEKKMVVVVSQRLRVVTDERTRDTANVTKTALKYDCE